MKKWVRFSHLLTTVRAEVADPSPPYSQPDRKYPFFLYDHFNNMIRKKGNDSVDKSANMESGTNRNKNWQQHQSR